MCGGGQLDTLLAAAFTACPSRRSTPAAVASRLPPTPLLHLLPPPAPHQVATFFFLTAVLGFGHGITGAFLFMALAQYGEPVGSAGMWVLRGRAA